MCLIYQKAGKETVRRKNWEASHLFLTALFIHASRMDASIARLPRTVCMYWLLLSWAGNFVQFLVSVVFVSVNHVSVWDIFFSNNLRFGREQFCVQFTAQNYMYKICKLTCAIHKVTKINYL